MKRTASKYLVIICILLLGKDIKSQEQNIAGLELNRNEITTSNDEAEPTASANINDDETTLKSQNGDSVAATYCKCDCNTGIIFTDMPTDNSASNQINEATTPINEIEDSIGNTMQTPLDSNTDAATTAVNTVTEAPLAEAQPPNTPALTNCTATGSFPSETNCRTYFTCAANMEGLLERTDIACPTKTAFNLEFGRCTRDIAACTNDGLVCTTAGTFEDPQRNSSYYWCVPRRIQAGFRKYHIDCEAGKVFVAQLGKCFIDINNLQNLPPNYNEQLDDEDIVEAELKLFKAEEKLKMKEEKLKLKLEKKLQKELAKKAAKDAKEQAKNTAGASKSEV